MVNKDVEAFEEVPLIEQVQGKILVSLESLRDFAEKEITAITLASMYQLHKTIGIYLNEIGAAA